jgi:hypothetical protein
VLGDEDVAAAYDPTSCDAMQAPSGDQIVIASGLIGSAGPDCALARDALESDHKLAIAFTIRRAYRDHVIISSQASYPAGAPSALLAIRSYEDVRRCLAGAPMSFVVRLKQAFLVQGDDSGFQHRVVANSAQRCSIDPAANRVREGRAWPGCTFQNGAIAFHVRGQGQGEPPPATGVQLLVKLNTPLPSAMFDAANLGLGRTSVLPVQMRYLEFSRYLYLVDIYDRGLVPIPAGDGPFPASVDATLTFN